LNFKQFYIIESVRKVLPFGDRYRYDRAELLIVTTERSTETNVSKSKVIGAALLLMGMTSAAMATAVTAPEIDPASAMTGLAMLAGTLAIVRGRRVKK
jgi:hypothetical protein